MTFKKCEKITVKVNSTKEKINIHSFDKDENIMIMSNSYNNVQEKRWDLNYFCLWGFHTPVVLHSKLSELNRWNNSHQGWY